MLPEMTPEERERYFKGDPADCNNPFAPPYEFDLLYGEIRIYEVPFEYRTRSAYVIACRFVRDSCPEAEADTEKKLIEHQLLSDIIKAAKEQPEKVDRLRSMYRNYFANAKCFWYNDGIFGWRRRRTKQNHRDK